MSYKQSQWKWSLFSVYFKIGFLNFSTICCWYTLELPQWGNFNVHLQYVSNPITECFFNIKQVFHKLLNYFLMFQCNEHVEMNKFLCSFACTWMTIIDSQIYIIDSLSLDISLEWNANFVVAWLYKISYCLPFYFFSCKISWHEVCYWFTIRKSK